MKKIEEIIVEFSSLEYDKKEPYLESLSDEELRTFLPHIEWSVRFSEKGFIEDLLKEIS